MVKSAAVLAASLSLTGSLWYWTAGQFTGFQAKQNDRLSYIQAHQGDGLRSFVCYIEQRTLSSKTLSEAQKIRGLRTLDLGLRKALLPPCHLRYK